MTNTTGAIQINAVKDDLWKNVLWGVIVVFVVFGGLFTWSFVAPIDGAVVAAGNVSVESNRKAVQHLEGGIVAKLFIKEGDYVKAGDKLVRLDDTVDRANLTLYVNHLEERIARKARLLAERDDAESIHYPKELIEQSDLPRIKEIISGQTRLFLARASTRASEGKILKQRIRQSKNEIEGLQARQLSNLKQIRFIEQELKGLRELYEEGYAPITRILALEREAESLRGERGGFIADIAKARNAINSSEIDILRLESSFKEGVISELRTIEAEIVELSERRLGLEDRLTRRDIYAPSSGFVIGLRIHTIGGVVAPGDTIMEIVPGDDNLVITARVRPEDIDKIHIGSEARIRLTAFNQRTTPEVHGTVKIISGDRILDSKTGAPYYMAHIDLRSDRNKKLGGLRLVPGMPAEVFIRTGERTAISYLFKPLSDSLSRAFKER